MQAAAVEDEGKALQVTRDESESHPGSVSLKT